ncbi:Uncharacterised protein [Providencia rustigianii]|uniref:Uncharacterized protein n=2 Tax=Providencia rustigianii TaxID=158850 RepID=D1P0G5_9GAMM|nr:MULTISPECIES: hypothetical protein [Providencia]EFB73163.1 hypothetical protein PROVRUST_05963 [Providencia rustigianii DSM 4541]SPY75971.1 Uncharacterised protein [Providencia rustigianii]SUC25095.1 Uncharacterised protein [Providencia rustigianii]SUC33923.1 Uncharacterised protein [Providencia rustigianii]VEB62949.1 Uncharacterised protein [Providencia rustigianii]
MKSKNSEIFEQIISVNKQQENEFNNGQDGALILSLLMIFLIPLSLFVMMKNYVGMDNSLIATIGVVALSLLIAIVLYKSLKINTRFIEKRPMLERLLSQYSPNDKNEFEKLQLESQREPSLLYKLVDDWLQTEKMLAVTVK